MSTSAYPTNYNISKSLSRPSVTPTVNVRHNRDAGRSSKINSNTNTPPSQTASSNIGQPRQTGIVTENRQKSIQPNKDASKQCYTFCSQPREIPFNKLSQQKLSDQRTRSAPTRNSSPIIHGKSKPKSASGSLAGRSHEFMANNVSNNCDAENVNKPGRSMHSANEEKSTPDASNKEQNKPKAPQIVLNARKNMFLHPVSQAKKQVSSPIPSSNQAELCKTPLSQDYKHTNTSPVDSPQNYQSTNEWETDIMDSAGMAVLLLEIQRSGDSQSNKSTSHQSAKPLDLSPYAYVVPQRDTQTFRASPDILNSNESISASAQSTRELHQLEMKKSANARLPDFSMSLIPDDNSTIGNYADLELTSTLQVGPMDTFRRPHHLDNDQQLDSTLDSEKCQVWYDATLKWFYDPKTGQYYEVIP